jgi:hypothetical protein
MAVIVPFQDLQRAREREREREHTLRCVEIIELNLQWALRQFHEAANEDRATHSRRIRRLGELLDYATRLL